MLHREPIFIDHRFSVREICMKNAELSNENKLLSVADYPAETFHYRDVFMKNTFLR